MYNWFINLNYVYQALIATTFTYLITILGSAVIFFIKKLNNHLINAMLGFASGVMLAASYFSLLSPALSYSNSLNINPWLTTALGFIIGGILLFLTDIILNKSLTKSKRKIIKLVSSITIHNIPEGLSIGISFGSIYYGLTGATTLSAIMLSLAIALQNFPEGSAVSLPLYSLGLSKKSSFFYGQLSAIVEPIFGVIGAILAIKARILLPFFLSFASGAMIYTIISELTPGSADTNNPEIMSFYTIIGFTIMMILDVALG